MNINQLETFSLAESAKFKDTLNPTIWNKHEHLKNAVRDQILVGAEEYCQYLGLRPDQVQDIVVAGANAGYLYEGAKDIDVVVIAELNPDATFRELFNEHKYQYNGQHRVEVAGHLVQFYVQPADEKFVTHGSYSILRECWEQIAVRRLVESKDTVKLLKEADLMNRPKPATVKKKKVIKERKPFVYGYGSDFITEVDITPDGTSPETCMFAKEDEQISNEEILKDFIEFCFKELKLQDMPVIKLRKDPQWSIVNKTFGRYNGETHTLEVAWGQRHIMDVLRTVGHELTHKLQHDRGDEMGPNAGDTGSQWENEANAQAGILMRNYAQLHPEFFAVGQAHDLHEYKEVKSEKAHRDGIDLEVRTNEQNMSIYAYDVGGREVAHVHFDKNDKNLVPYDLEVGDDYRGQGIAAVMYDYAKELGYRVTRSPDQTDAGKYFWDKNRGEEGRVWEDLKENGYIPTAAQAHDLHESTIDETVDDERFLQQVGNAVEQWAERYKSTSKDKIAGFVEPGTIGKITGIKGKTDAQKHLLNLGMMFFLLPKDAGGKHPLGAYRPAQGDWGGDIGADIRYLIPDAVLKKSKKGQEFTHTLMTHETDLASTVAHELRHALDDYLSKGKYDSSAHKFDYHDQNVEINAFFTQALKSLQQMIDDGTVDQDNLQWAIKRVFYNNELIVNLIAKKDPRVKRLFSRAYTYLQAQLNKEHSQDLKENGYIPTAAQAHDPRFEMALSVDVHPGATGKIANKFLLNTDAQGHPQELRPDGMVQRMLEEYKQYKK